MTPARIAWAFSRRSWGQALLSLMVAALGIAGIVLILVAQRSIPAAAQRTFGGVDLVVGPKGSALDLVLCCALHISDPQGLIPLDASIAAVKGPMVRRIAPIALGDNIAGIRIVGTTADILPLYGADFARGGLWEKPLQAVLGAQAAAALHLDLGAQFVGAHGLGAGGEQHDAFPYTVTGVLKPTGTMIDRLVLTDLESVYAIHRHEAEEEAGAADGVRQDSPKAATALLVGLRSKVALASVPRMIDATPDLSAASPMLVSARMLAAVRPVLAAGFLLGALIVGIAVATTAASLAAAMQGRTKDLALLRILGAHPRELAAVALIESGVQAAIAALLGIVIAVAVAHVAAGYALDDGLILDIWPQPGELSAVLLGALVAALAAAAIPALRASHTPIEGVLAP